jgi:hypothetical protein
LLEHDREAAPLFPLREMSSWHGEDERLVVLLPAEPTEQCNYQYGVFERQHWHGLVSVLPSTPFGD